MKILFTSVGRRRYLVEYFIEESVGRHEIHVANSDPHCAAFSLGVPRVITPPIYSSQYISFLVDYCTEYQIDAVISLFDADLPVLAENAELFKKRRVRVLVSNSEVIATCNDKWRAGQYLNGLGIKTPQTFLSVSKAMEAVNAGGIATPLVVKPRWGMGSIAVKTVHAIDRLSHEVQDVKKEIDDTYLCFESSQAPDDAVLIQEKLSGSEYGLDIFNDLDGNYIATCVKRKLAMRSGETDAAVTECSELLRQLGETIGTSLRHIGNLDVDVFVDGDVATVLEMNARFGGGYPFSHLAGINLPKAIFCWLENKKAPNECFAWKPGVKGVKSIVPLRLA